MLFPAFVFSCGESGGEGEGGGGRTKGKGGGGTDPGSGRSCTLCPIGTALSRHAPF